MIKNIYSRVLHFALRFFLFLLCWGVLGGFFGGFGALVGGGVLKE